jgi:arylsulfatase A-like enzyme
MGGLGAVCLAFLVCVGLLTSTRSERKYPHIVFVLSDDVGWDDFSIHGGTTCKTPHIDALAAESVVLDNYYTQPVCSPARASLMTGRHVIHTGVFTAFGGVSSAYLDTKFSILPQYLKSCCNYSSHVVGKVSVGVNAKKHNNRTPREIFLTAPIVDSN